MIKNPTVLILGAGASAHLNYPIGSGLINEICQSSNVKDLKQFCEDESLRNKIDEFTLHLSRAQYYSIDAFLEENSEFIDIGKLFITYILKKHEYEELLFPPQNPGWYKELFTALLTESISDFCNNKIAIITYNYDRSLEVYLHNAIQYRYKCSSEKAIEILNGLPIIHIHGVLGEYPNIEYKIDASYGELKNISEKIKIIFELDSSHDDGFCSDEYREAYNFLKSAKNIYFLGFGFHESNMKRFSFFNDENLRDKNYACTLAGLGPIGKKELLNYLKNYGFSDMKSGGVCNDFFSHVVSFYE